MRISPEYLRLNQLAHEQSSTYGTVSPKWAPVVVDLTHSLGVTSILDYGCGKAMLKRAFTKLAPSLAARVDFREYDPAIPGKDAEPEPADFVICTDVMEHVEPEYTRAVLDHAVGLAKVAVLLDVSCALGSRRLADGEPAHRNIHPPEWWAKKISRYGKWERLPAPGHHYAAILRHG